MAKVQSIKGGAKAKKAKKVYADTDAGRAEKFRDFVNARMTRAVRALRAVAKLANRKAYGYTSDNVKLIGDTLNDELQAVARAFKSGGAKSAPVFQLPEPKSEAKE